MKTNKNMYNMMLDLLIQSKGILIDSLDNEKELVAEEKSRALMDGDRVTVGCYNTCMHVLEKTKMYVNNIDLVQLVNNEIDSIEAEK